MPSVNCCGHKHHINGMYWQSIRTHRSFKQTHAHTNTQKHDENPALKLNVSIYVSTCRRCFMQFPWHFQPTKVNISIKSASAVLHWRISTELLLIGNYIDWYEYRTHWIDIFFVFSSFVSFILCLLFRMVFREIELFVAVFNLKLKTWRDEHQ